MEKYFGSKELEILSTPKFRLAFHGVTVNVVPDLCVKDGPKTRMIKLQFGGNRLPEQSVKVITQCLLEAARSQGFDCPSSSVVYIDLPRDAVYSAPRAGKRVLQDIRAACETISQIWESIPPPAKSKRSAAA